VPKISVKGKMFESAPLTDEILANADLVMIVTDHSTYDYKNIAEKAKLIIDTRNAIKEKNEKVIRF
jgi:UDP-N-acetyl-D-glucosamine dehydrogenase